MNSVRARVEQCFQAAFPELAKEDIPQASISSVAEWDSLGTMTLLSLIEEEFGRQIPPENLGDFSSFGLIVDYLQAGDDDAST